MGGRPGELRPVLHNTQSPRRCVRLSPTCPPHPCCRPHLLDLLDLLVRAADHVVRGVRHLHGWEEEYSRFVSNKGLALQYLTPILDPAPPTRSPRRARTFSTFIRLTNGSTWPAREAVEAGCAQHLRQLLLVAGDAY